MSCKVISSRARTEQDYWLLWTWDEWDGNITEEQRLEFLRYDSHGGNISTFNPIYIGKSRHSIQGNMMVEEYFSGDTSWMGGICWYEIFYMAYGKRGIKSLEEWFGIKTVEGWFDALTYEIIYYGWLNPYGGD